MGGDYPGKVVSSLEDPATAFISDEGTGWFSRLPERIPLRDIIDARVTFHWTPMPTARKVLLLLGLVSLLAFMEWPAMMYSLRRESIVARRKPCLLYTSPSPRD